MVQQSLMDDVQGMKDASTDGSSLLGKYIMGAKNNFRGFSSKRDDNNTPQKVTVHQGRGEDADKEGKSGAAGASECGRKSSDCDVVKMEEGQVQSKLGAGGDTESKEEVEAGRKTNTGNEEEEELGAGTSSVQAGARSEPTPDEANRVGKTPPGQTGGKKGAEKSAKQAESTNKGTDRKSTAARFEDTELPETNRQAQWEKGRNTEHNLTRTSDVGESGERPGTKKSIPSPTGSSSSSQDTGFGSREGEASIDGRRVNP